MKYAIIKNNIVENMIVWDGVTPYFPPENSILIETENGDIGDTYDSVKKIFIKPKPYPSWILNEDTGKWEAPVSYPNDMNDYVWNEKIQNWEKI